MIFPPCTSPSILTLIYSKSVCLIIVFEIFYLQFLTEAYASPWAIDDWAVQSENQAGSPERSDRVGSFRADGAHILQGSLVVPGELGVRATPRCKQIPEVFVYSVAQRNGHIFNL